MRVSAMAKDKRVASAPSLEFLIEIQNFERPCSKWLSIHIFSGRQQVLPHAALVLRLATLQFILLALWPIRICFTLSLFIFPPSY
jgi:hypothetical protein